MKRTVLRAGLAGMLVLGGIIASTSPAPAGSVQRPVLAATASRDLGGHGVDPFTADGVELRTLRASRSRQPAGRPYPIIRSSPAFAKPVGARRVIHAASTPVGQHAHRAPAVGPAFSSGSEAWAHSRDGFRVSNCESGDRHASDVDSRYNGDSHMRDGSYHGKWQMDHSFWATYGGLRFADDPAAASESEQDIVGFNGYKARGWQPWSCAGIMGVG